MRTTSAPQRLIASSLSLLLVSCSVTRYSTAGPTSAQELSRHVLIIQETADGQVFHSWKPLHSFDLSRYPSPHGAENSTRGGRIVHAAWTRDCDEEFRQCVRMCVGSLKGVNWKHATRASKEEICRTRCYPAYRDCSELRERAEAEALEFSATDEAVDWLKRNGEQLLVGTVIVIAGAAFVVLATGSAGMGLILAPALLLASTEPLTEPQLAVSKP